MAKHLLNMTLVVLAAIALAMTMVACGGGGGGGDEPVASLVGSWERTSATSSPGAMVQLTFNGNASGGTLTGVQLDGQNRHGNWSLSGQTLRVWGGNLNPVTVTIRFTGENTMDMVQSDGTSHWRRQ